MRILAITPLSVDQAELSRRQRRYHRLSPAGVSVRLENLGNGSEVPRALETEEDIAASEAAVAARFAAADDTEVDAFLPDCVLDPAVDAQGQSGKKPLLGILKLSAHFLQSQGAGVGAVARNEAIARELDRKLSVYGLQVPLGGTAVLGLSVDDISDDGKWGSAVAGRLGEIHADYVINGCSAVDIDGGHANPVLIDPTALALNLIGLIHAGAEQPLEGRDE